MNRAVVVCSGGLDSTVMAASAWKTRQEMTLLHFRYGNRAQDRELAAVQELAVHLTAKLVIMDMIQIFTAMEIKSSLLGTKEHSEEAEKVFPCAWVPARNLIMLSIGIGYCEAHSIPWLYFGINLEEGQTYPDNRGIFIEKLQAVIPHAIQTGKEITILSPLVDMMKGDIVTYGESINAPMELSWSCYKAGLKHCGTCPSCQLRRAAFKSANVRDKTEYEGE